MKTKGILIVSVLFLTGTCFAKPRITHFCAVQESSMQISSVPLNNPEAQFGDKSLIPGTEFGTANLSLSGGEVKPTAFTSPTINGTVTMYKVTSCSDPKAIHLVEKKSFWGTSISLDKDNSTGK
ncbi:MAG: hypothetical protein ACYDCD_13640 [Candidatus Acidiferrales bacterium]